MTALAVITGFSALWLLAAAGAASLPLIAHLLSRRGGPAVVFPAVYFVMQAAADHARRRRLRDITLLLLRILILVLLALAFDRPMWTTDPRASEPGEARDLIVVLDASASMTRPHDGRPLFETARDQAIRLLSDLDPATDSASVIVAAGSPSELLPGMTQNLDVLIDALRATGSTLEHADTESALAEAAAIRASATDRDAEVVVFTDLQRGQWAEVTPPAGLPLTIRRVGPETDDANRGVIDVSVLPASPAVGDEVMLAATVANYSAQPASLNVRLTNQGETVVRSQRVNIGAGETVTLTFPVEAASPGQQAYTVAIDEDDFAADDRRRITFAVRGTRRIALVTQADPQDASRHLRYLSVALQPDEQDLYRWRAVLLPANGLTESALRAFDVVCLADAGRPDDRSLAAIANAARSGVGVVWVIDSDAATGAAIRFESMDERNRLPVEITGPFQTFASKDALRIGDVAFDAPPFEAINDASDAIRRQTTMAVAQTSARPDAMVCAALNDGRPLVAWKPFGRGRIAVVASDAAPDVATFARSPLYPVVVHGLAELLASRSEGAVGSVVGEPTAARVVAAGLGESPLTDEHGQPARVTASFPGAPATIRGRPADAPGFVTFSTTEGRTVGVAAVNLASSESDLRGVDASGLAERLAEADAASTLHAASDPLAERRRIELWPWLILAALLGLGAESLLANRARSNGGARS